MNYEEFRRFLAQKVEEGYSSNAVAAFDEDFFNSDVKDLSDEEIKEYITSTLSVMKNYAGTF